MSEEDRLRELVIEMRFLENGLNELNARQSLLVRALVESRIGLETLKGLSKPDPSNVLIPIGGGLFVRSETPPPDRLLVNVGGDVVVEKSRDEAVPFVEGRIGELENAMAGLQAQKEQMTERLDRTREAINSMVGQRQG